MTALGKIINVEDALEISVCHAGPLAAVGIQTRSGKHVFHVPTSVIVALRSSPSDANGNPWPVPGAADPDRAYVASSAASRSSRQEVFERAWEAFKADPTRPLNRIARELGLPDNSVSGYFIAKHSEEYAALRAEYGRAMGPTSSERLLEIEEAYDDYSKRGVTAVVLAARLQMPVPVLNTWLNRIRKRREAACKNVSEREPVLKPNGEIL
jgi:hypothetical protein